VARTDERGDVADVAAPAPWEHRVAEARASIDRDGEEEFLALIEAQGQEVGVARSRRLLNMILPTRARLINTTANARLPHDPQIGAFHKVLKVR